MKQALRTVREVQGGIVGAERVRILGRDAGFPLVRISRALPLHVERARYLEWIAQGRHGSMRWIDELHAERSASPSRVLPAVKSVVSVGLPYWRGKRPVDDPTRGRLARYSWGEDYHEVMGGKLQVFGNSLSEEFGGEHRWYVDTGPVMDKAHAARSGLGFYGKNTNILTEDYGSFVLLGEVLTSLDLQPDAPLKKSCGSCRLCVVACPTGALGPEYTIDSRRCISYLTIEHRGSIPVELRPQIGNWVFGCDVCQDVCPPTMAPYLEDDQDRREWIAEVRNYAKSPSQIPSHSGGRSRADEAVDGEGLWGGFGTNEPVLGAFGAAPLRRDVDLMWLLGLSHEEYVEAFRGTAIKRAKVWMLRRNAAIALGNVGDETSREPLIDALRGDDHPLVRGHAAWALGRLRNRLGTEVDDALEEAIAGELDESVREEIRCALGIDREANPAVSRTGVPAPR